LHTIILSLAAAPALLWCPSQGGVDDRTICTGRRLMKSAVFGYHRASSIAEAVEYLEAYEGTARLIAGGQSLVPMMNMRLLRPDALIDLNGIGELAEIRAVGDNTEVGAMVRYTMLERSPLVAERLPLLAAVVGHIGDRQVRNRGTLGGSVVHGDPTGEMPLACLVLGARVRVVGPTGGREIPMEEFYEGSYATVLDSSEMVTGVIFPAGPAHFAFAECCRRHNDFAIVSVAAVGSQAPTGEWSGVRVALGGVADGPTLAEAANRVLLGTRMSDDDIATAAEAALEAVDPASDVRASAEYRRHLVPIYVRRVLAELRRSGAQEVRKEVG
jgi:carbon-monoxide dehydrogenase medium subunit